MSEKGKDFLIYLATGAVVAVAVFAMNMSRGYGILRCLCDGPFVASVFLLGIGGIKAARNQGTFDTVGFGLRSALDVAIPALRRDEKETMEQYRARKAQERKSSKGMLLAGLVYFLLSVLALVIYELAGG